MSGMEQFDNAKKASSDQVVSSIDINKEFQDSNLNQQVFKSSSSDKVPGVQLEAEESMQTGARKRIEPPHAWYENSKPTYQLPSEAVVMGGVKQALVAGWRRLDK